MYSELNCISGFHYRTLTNAVWPTSLVQHRVAGVPLDTMGLLRSHPVETRFRCVRYYSSSKTAGSNSIILFISQAPPVFVPASASAEEKTRITDMRRHHPLFQSITLMLLTEIINSRLFTTVRDTLGLTYDVSWEVRQIIKHI